VHKAGVPAHKAAVPGAGGGKGGHAAPYAPHYAMGEKKRPGRMPTH
jgi:hypothetical protein